MDCTTWKYFRKLTLSGVLAAAVILSITPAIPKKGMAISIATTIKIKTEATITKRANINCGKGFIPRKAVVAIALFFVLGQR
jgi:hypothetical protein